MTAPLPYVGDGPGQFSVIAPLLPYKVGEWVLLAPLVYTDQAGQPHAIPKYFITDLASIPWLVEPIFRAVDTRLPGVAHDAFYCFNTLSRQACDDLLAEMLQVTGCDLLRAHLVYVGVRVGGAARYRACAGGPTREDFAWELMTAQEVRDYEAIYGVSPAP